MVKIRYKTGSVRLVPDYVGKRLVERRIADFYPGHVPLNPPQPPAVEPVVEQPTAEPEAEQAIDLDALTRDELYALAVERGLEPHHKTGEAKLRAMLQ